MRASRLTLCSLGGVGLTLSLLGAVAWYMVYVPHLNLRDLDWLERHTDSETCTEIARVQPIWGWDHDMSMLVMSCDSQWVGKILSDARPKDLASTHLGVSLRAMTGQAIGDEDLDAWRRWYAEHQYESQQEWLRSGFANVAITVPAVLSSSDVRVLLQWMGEKHSNLEPHIYTAFLLLRDQDAMRKIRLSGPDTPMTPAEVVGFSRFVMWSSRSRAKYSETGVTPASRLIPPFALATAALLFSCLLGWSLGRATGAAS